MDAFTPLAQSALDTLFGVFGRVATFTAAGGSPVSITAVLEPVQSNVDGFDVGVRTNGVQGKLRVSELPTQPRSNHDTLTVDGTTYRISGVTLDSESFGLLWIVTLEPT